LIVDRPLNSHVTCEAVRSTSILLSHLCIGLWSGLSLWDFPTKLLYPFSPHVHITFFDFISQQYQTMSTNFDVPCYKSLSVHLKSGYSAQNFVILQQKSENCIYGCNWHVSGGDNLNISCGNQ
jgi:hypothetical protein